MNTPLESKLPDVGTTIFTVMSRLANECGAINLSQGFPDFEGPQLLRDRAAWHMNNGHNQYSPLAGVPPLCEAIADKVLDLYGARIDPQREVCVTPGATEALSTSIAAVIHPGDEAIILDPAYDSYDPCIRLNGGLPVHVPMNGDFSIDWDRVRAAVTARTKLLIINSPHNPSGAAWAGTDIEALRSLLADYPLTVLSDEVYEHIVFDGREHLGLLRYPDLRARAFVVSSFGKTYHATGWRIGYCIAPPAFMEEFLRIHQYTNFSANAPLQFALADVLRDMPEHHIGLGAFYQEKRDHFLALLADTPLTCRPAAGTYFQVADYSAVSDLPDTAFAEWLTREIGVAAIPLTVFYESPPDQRLVRFCFAKDEATLEAAARRLATL